VFGKERDKGIRLQGLTPEVVSLADVPESSIIVHDETNPVLAAMLAHMRGPDFPTPIGVLFAVERPVYDEAVHDQLGEAKRRNGDGDLERLFRRGDVWTVS